MTDSCQFVLNLPEWLIDTLNHKKHTYPDIEDRMRFVIELSKENIRQGTGGPFGAAVFTKERGEVVSAGVNLVTYLNCSAAHAEIVAITMAQQKVQTFDLGGCFPCFELVTSAEPCIMCYGAIMWSGIHRLICGARTEDVERIGFDEGEKPAQWQQLLEKRNITVIRDICRKQASDVLISYKNSSGVIYNARQPIC